MLGIVGTGFPYALNQQIIMSEGATVASTVTYLLPVVAAEHTSKGEEEEQHLTGPGRQGARDINRARRPARTTRRKEARYSRFLWPFLVRVFVPGFS